MGEVFKVVVLKMRPYHTLRIGGYSAKRVTTEVYQSLAKGYWKRAPQ